MKRATVADAVVLIPAFDEAATVATVVGVAREAGIGPVVVVDDGSRDGTAEAAAAAGAEVVRLPRNLGKGGAVAAGARARREAVVVLLDADLTGLQPQHVRALAEPVLARRADMARGVFAGGRWRTTLVQRALPVLNGQRALRRTELLKVDGLDASRYGVEIAITEHAQAHGWRTMDVPLPGVSQVMKEEKRGALRGLAIRLRMYGEILHEFARRHLGALGRPRRARRTVRRPTRREARAQRKAPKR